MIPIFLGVTGHRSISRSSIASARISVRQELDWLHQRYPFTQIIVLSALAEGADRLVAEIALDCNCEVWAVLPTCADEYLNDFSSGHSKNEFTRLLGKCSRIINASVFAGYGEGFNERPKMYEHLADQLCQMSHILMALWDGDPRSEEHTSELQSH